MISFRRAAMADMAKLHEWRNRPHVSRWFGGPLSYEQLLEKTMPKISGKVPARAYIIEYDGIDIGYIQTYMISDFPEYAGAVDAGAGTAGMDLYIGESEYIHRGLGPDVMKEFLRSHVFSEKDTKSCMVGPDPLNLAATKAYRKAGFRYLRTVRVPGEENPEALYIINREDL